jgi:hypothetical protein
MYERYRGKRVAAELLCRQEVARHSVPVAQGRRISIFAAMASCLLLALVLVLFFQVRGFLAHLETRLAVESGGNTRIHAIGQHMEALQGKFNALLAESVEMRLKTLEKSVETGKVGAVDLRTFEVLKNDLELLENYAVRSGALGFDYAQQEHSRFRAVPETKPIVRNDELMNEILALRSLFYLCLATLGLSVVIAGGYWLHQRKKVRWLESMAAHRPMLTEQSSDSPR